MKRLFWVALGASAGVLIARQLRQTAEAFAPTTVLGNAAAAVRDFWDEARTFAADREVELRRTLGLDED